MAENYNDFKREDLIEVIKGLQEENDNLEGEVAELNKELTVATKRAKKGGSGGNNDIDADLDSRIEEMQDQLAEADTQIAKLKEELTDSNASRSIMKSEKQELEKKSKEQAKKIEDLEKDLLQTLAKSREAEKTTKEMQKYKGDSVRETKKLFDENEQLQQENKQMNDQMRTLQSKIQEYELAITELHEKNEDLEVKFEGADLKHNELLQTINELEKQVEEAQDKLAVAHDVEGQWEIQLNEVKKEFKLKIDAITADLKASKTENMNLNKQILMLKDSTAVGEKQRQIDHLTAEHDEVLKLLDEKTQELSIVSADKIKLAEYLADLERKMDQKVAERVVLEKEKAKNLQAALLSKESSHVSELERYKDMEVEKNALVREVDELNHWKAIYENGHGLRELARNQKRLKDENRSLGVLVEHITNDKNILTDKINLIEKAFEKLCVETGKPADFMYPQYELEDEIVGDYARMKAQINELEEQIGALETDNTRLRKTLKNQAGSIGEQGFKYAGMSPDMLIKVNEFAANLRDGKLELPVDDRSSELLKANKRLRDEIRGLNLQIERYERELGGNLSSAPSAVGNTQQAAAMSKVQETELFGLREDMRRLAKENAELHNRFTTMQAEMMLAIRSHLSGGEVSAKSEGKSTKGDSKVENKVAALANTDEIAALVLANNDLLMRELQELKATSFHMLAINEKANTLGRSQLLTRGDQPTDLPPTGKKGVLSTPKPVENENFNFMSTPRHFSGYTPFNQSIQLNGPATPHGKQLLAKNISQLNLPPEEWTEEVKDLNGQLIECLEQLYEKEEELEEQRGTISELENNLVTIKQQVASLYHDFAAKMDAWDEREKQYKRDNAILHDEQDDLRLKLKRTQEIIDMVQKDDKDTMEAKLLELNRKATIYEVNEAVLARKFVSQQEQMEQDQQLRKRLEIDFSEMEATLKKRILFLEQYKMTTSSRIAYLQGTLDSSVPQDDYLALQTELDNLREDHLLALRREVDARVAAFKTHELSSELQVLRLNTIQLQAELSGAKKSVKNLQSQLNHEKELTTRALASANSNAELSSIISEMAKFRGEASRLEVELSASNRRYELSVQEMQRSIAEKEEMMKRVQEMEAREEAAETREAEARKKATENILKYEGGCDKTQAAELRLKIEKITRDLEEAQREASRHREMAEISSLQAQSIGFYRQQHEEELKSLREYCTKLESRGDDEILIGRLQRQLMSTKTSYKAFVRKYQILRGNMRQRELAMRVLETRLDQREEVVFKMNETHRFEISALKKALRNLTEIVDPNITSGKHTPSKKKDRSDRQLMTIGQKLLSFSQKVNELAAKAEESISKSVAAVEDSRRYQGIAEDAILERDLLSQRSQDLESLTKGNTKQNNIASRLIALSDEVRLNKLSVLQQRRQIQVLKEEKRHLQSLISTIEADVEDLEEGKILAETKNLLGDATNRNDEISKAHDSMDAVIQDYKNLNSNFLSLSSAQPTNSSKKPLSATKLEIIVDNSADFEKENDLGPEEYIKKIQALNDQLKISRKSASDNKLLSDKLNGQINELQMLLKDRESQLSFYEKMPVEGSSNVNNTKYDVNNRQFRMMRDEQEKLQEAASTTIGSLRALIDEKNRTIEKYRQKLESQGLDKKVKSNIDLKADKLLERLNSDSGQQINGTSSKNNATNDIGGASSGQNQKLLDQIRDADELLQDKDHLITQLEQKLAIQNNQRERAEVRCGASIKEMEAMKNDMITLAKQLQLSEERCHQLAKSSVGSVKVVNTADGSNKQVQKLQNLLKVKDEKLKSYREIIVRLKDEFIKVEEERAIEATSNSKSKDLNSNANQAIGAEDIRELRSQIAALRDGLKKAKEELESARKNREKLSQARQAAQEEAERLEAQVGRAEAQASSAQESLQRCRKELEETRKKELRLRDKVKELMENVQNQNDNKSAENPSGSKLEKLQIEIEVLKAQNQALRRASENESFAKARDSENIIEKSNADNTKFIAKTTDEVKFTTKGNTLGTTPAAGENGPVDELRQMQHSKWEAEKKLLKRLNTLEKRLQEKIDENGELQAQLKRAREQIQTTSAAKEEFQKKAAAAMKSTQDNKKFSADDVSGLEEIQSKYFKLEEQNTVLRKKIEVELASEIALFKQQLSEARKREDQLKIELEESEELRKRSASGPGGRTLRDSEDRFMKEERLKDELSQARQQRLELESALLERDARAMEHRFDLEAREQEVVRLKRRNKELEAAYRSLSQVGGTGNKGEGFGSPARAKTAWTEDGGERGAGARFNRERDLEGVVEAMKRVVDKLKTENDRLRKGGGPEERKAGDAEKKAAEQKKRADKLDEEMKSLQAKLKGYEESNQKLTQRQQQVTALRKQLKTREDELLAFREQSQSVLVERDNLKKQLANTESRIEQLESSLQHSSNKTNRGDNNNQQLQKEVGDLKRKLLEQAVDLEKTKEKLAEAIKLGEKSLKDNKTSLDSATANNNSAEVKRLKEENERLRQELSAFDLDFFEEIENLKFAHAEAIRKLKVYEASSKR